MAGEGSRGADCENAVRGAFNRPQIRHPAAIPSRTSAARGTFFRGSQQAENSSQIVQGIGGGGGPMRFDTVGAESNTSSAQRIPFRSDCGTGVGHGYDGDGGIQDVSDAQRRCACCCTDHRRIPAHAESAPERNRAPSLTAHRLDLWKPPPCELPCTSHLPADLRSNQTTLTAAPRRTQGRHRLETRISRKRNAIPEGPTDFRKSDPPQMR